MISCSCPLHPPSIDVFSPLSSLSLPMSDRVHLRLVDEEKSGILIRLKVYA